MRGGTKWKMNPPMGQRGIPIEEKYINWEMSQPMGHNKIPIEIIWMNPLVNQG